MKLKTHELFEHLERKPLAPVYLFTGEEGYFMERALGKLLDRALLGAPRDFNLDVFYGKDARADEIALQASTLPMMAERRAVVLKEADRLRDLAPVKEYLKSPSDTTVFVMVAMDADRAKERTLTDAVPKNGVAVHFYHPFENQLPDYVRIIAKDSGFNIDRQASAYLIDMLGGNLALIEAELNKLFNLLGERKTVTYEDAKESVGDFGMPLVFDLIDSVAARKPAEALELLARLLREGEQPLMLLAVMAGHWRKLVAAKEEGFKGRPFGPEKKVPEQAERMSAEGLVLAFRAFQKADSELKSSPVPPRIIMERLVLELCGAGSAAAV